MTSPRRTEGQIPPAPDPALTVTVTLTGGAHLHEFTSFSARAIWGFDPRGQGRHCLRGPYLRSHGEVVPPMNQAVPYVLPANARAVYVYGKSAAGAAHDVHAVLVPDPGAQVVVPLTVATDEKRREVARLVELLQDASFVFAHTMADNPHCYTRRSTWASDAEFEFAVSGTRRYGWRQPYIPPGETEVAYRETVFEAGSHLYFSGWQPPAITGWLNRKKLPSPVEARVVDQTLTAHDARRLDLPPLPRDFAGLEPLVTQCPFFQAGVALFGYVAPDGDMRPRLRKRSVK